MDSPALPGNVLSPPLVLIKSNYVDVGSQRNLILSTRIILMRRSRNLDEPSVIFRLPKKDFIERRVGRNLIYTKDPRSFG